MAIFDSRKKMREVQVGVWVEVPSSGKHEWKRVKALRYQPAYNDFPASTTLVFEEGDSYEDFPESLIVVQETDPTGRPNAFSVPDWDEYFLTIAQAVAARAKCRRRQVGAVLVGSDKRIISTGYNGFPSGAVSDCLQGGCPRGLTKAGDIPADSPYTDPTAPGFCPALHAEANCAKFSSWDERQKSTMYVTDKPCPDCMRFIAGGGIIRVVWPEGEMDPMDFYETETRK